MAEANKAFLKEFGYLPDGRIALIDECVTPDSSRFWKKSGYIFVPEKNKFQAVQGDKQPFRDYIEKLGLHIAFGRSDHFGGQVGAAKFSKPEEVVHVKAKDNEIWQMETFIMDMSGLPSSLT
jgi:phosphoribosylaminoimidazole-succinocarboxamide synthase